MANVAGAFAIMYECAHVDDGQDSVEPTAHSEILSRLVQHCRLVGLACRHIFGLHST